MPLAQAIAVSGWSPSADVLGTRSTHRFFSLRLSASPSVIVLLPVSSIALEVSVMLVRPPAVVRNRSTYALRRCTPCCSTVHFVALWSQAFDLARALNGCAGGILDGDGDVDEHAGRDLLRSLPERPTACRRVKS